MTGFIMNIATIAFTLHLAVQAAANPFVAESKQTVETEYISKLLAAAKPTSNSQLPRDLTQNNFDLGGYSVKYDRCQFVNYTEVASSSSTVLGTSNFVIFRLCPTGTCNSCTSNYGEYVIDLEQYLTYTVAFQVANQTMVCNYCDACVDHNTSGSAYVDCSICTDECSKINNMASNGYLEATIFSPCTLIYDPPDENGVLYADVMCASSGGKVNVGVFTDAYCINLDSTKRVDDYLVDANGSQLKLSYAVLKKVYDSSLCISCDDNGAASDMCVGLCNYAAKCEVSHGFTTGIASATGYETPQTAQEERVCSYITDWSVAAGDSGEILAPEAPSKTASSKSRKKRNQHFKGQGNSHGE